ncbi:ABC transporter substrate-binding protein [Streptomyces sp. NBC_01618]|uniref:ABC transporter substrate-binding protein n=1 Tax=Streptomyces sp. NBC_01618 TaxID=2975900 RepID=UPI0038663441|nr:ABC transporter substrate-binding protein [Streptomyces sp. NBC_01618]
MSFYSQVADEQGVFKDNDLQVKLVPVQTSAQALSAMLSGSLDLAPGTPDPFVLAKAKGSDLRAVAATTQETVFQIIAGSKHVDAGGDLKARTEALKGKSVAVYGRGNASDRFVDFLFDAVDITGEPVYVIAGASKTVAAFLAGKVDFASDTVQVANLLEAAGKGGTYINCATDGYPTGYEGDKQMYWTTGKFADANPEALRRFIKAMDDTQEWVQDAANEERSSPT